MSSGAAKVLVAAIAVTLCTQASATKKLPNRIVCIELLLKADPQGPIVNTAVGGGLEQLYEDAVKFVKEMEGREKLPPDASTRLVRWGHQLNASIIDLKNRLEKISDQIEYGLNGIKTPWEKKLTEDSPLAAKLLKLLDKMSGEDKNPNRYYIPPERIAELKEAQEGLAAIYELHLRLAVEFRKISHRILNDALNQEHDYLIPVKTMIEFSTWPGEIKDTVILQKILRQAMRRSNESVKPGLNFYLEILYEQYKINPARITNLIKNQIVEERKQQNESNALILEENLAQFADDAKHGTPLRTPANNL